MPGVYKSLMARMCGSTDESANERVFLRSVETRATRRWGEVEFAAFEPPCARQARGEPSGLIAEA